MITALIPARQGSKRIANKNAKPLDGKPLFAHSILTAQHCESIDEIVFSTDSEKYADMAKAPGVITLLRPPELATDEATDYDVVQHMLDNVWCNVDSGDMLVYLRPTTPIRAAGTVERAIQEMREVPASITGLRSVEEMSESAHKAFRINFFLEPLFGSMADTNKSSQLLPKTYKANGYVDIILPREGKVTQGVYGDRCIPFITPRTIDIDTMEDFEYAEWLIKMYGFREEVKFR